MKIEALVTIVLVLFITPFVFVQGQSDNSWISLAPVPVKMSGRALGAAEIGGKIYVLGEVLGEVFDQNTVTSYLAFYQYDPHSNTWQNKTSLSEFSFKGSYLSLERN